MNDQAEIESLQRKLIELEKVCAVMREALQALYTEQADYIRINYLGDVHHNRSMQMARDALSTTTGTDLLAERDRYKAALMKLLTGDHNGPLIGTCTMKIVEDALSWIDEEVAQFMKEWDQGKHQLSAEDESALARSKPELLAKLKQALQKEP